MSVAEFENSRWGHFSQKLEFRHRACLDLVEGETALDIGCGDGLLLGELKKKGITSTGVDVSSEAVRRCEAAGLHAIEHSLDNSLPFPDGSFDTVTLLDVLEHVYDPLTVLREAKRVARKSVIVGVPNFSSLPARIQTLLGRVPENNTPEKGHLYWFNYPVLIALVKEAGLTLGDVRMNTFSLFRHLPPSVCGLAPNLLALSFVAKLRPV